mgnify:CR=1 FL=1
MAVNLSRDDEELIRLSASQAALPQYQQMQAQGIEALGDILGMDTGIFSDYAQQKEEELRGFQPERPERLLESPKPFDWWKEKAALNSMNTIVPMMGFAIGTTMQAIPHPIAKIVGKGINWATFAITYNANLADTLQEHEDTAGRELSRPEKLKAAVVASGVTYLDMLVPRTGASAMSQTIAKTFGKGGLEATKKSLQSMVLMNRQSLAAQAKTGGKFLGGLVAKEMGTEAGQKALQIGTSVEPGRLATSEGLQDILEESVIAGPTVGIVGSPAAVGQARSFNRDINTARRLSKEYNQGLAEQQSIRSKKSIAGDKINIPEYQSTFNKLAKEGGQMFEKKVGAPLSKTAMGTKVISPIKEGLIKGYRGIAEKPLAELDRIVRNADSGFVFHTANKLRQMFVPTESGSNQLGESIGPTDFYSVRDTKSGLYLKPVIEILNKYSNKQKFAGHMFKSFDPNVSKYFVDSLRTEGGIADPSLLNGTGVSKESIDADIQTIREQLDLAHSDLRQSGIGIEYIEDYLTNPVSPEAVEKNRAAFIKILKKSNARAVKEAKAKGEKVRKLTDKEINRIADDIIGNVDPDILTVRESLRPKSKKQKQGPVKQPGFEKARSATWKYVDEYAAEEGLNFREQNIEKVLTGYLQKVATRVASVRAFGQNASLLKKHLDDLVSANAIEQKDIDRVYDVYDGVHNLYKKDADPDLLAVSKVATTVGAITHLGLATLSSITELAWIGERAGFRHMLATIPKALRYSMEGIKTWKQSKYVEPGENQQAMSLLGFNLDPRVNERLDALFSTDHNAILNAWFRGPMGAYLTQWTNFNRNWAAQAMLHNINHRANSIIAGDISDIEQRRLNSELKENGISQELFQELINVFTDPVTGKVKVDILDKDKMNQVLRTKRVMVKPATKKKQAKYLSKKDARQIRARDLLMPWLHKVVDDVVVHPKATNRPMWMSDPKFAIIAQLKTFPIVFGNTVVKRLLKKLNPKQCSPDFGAAVGAAGGIAMAYALVHAAEMMKAAIRQTDYEDPGIRETLDRAGLTGWVGLVGGAGRFQEGATTALGGTAFSFVDRAFEDFLSPIYTGGTAEEKLEAFPNLGTWLAESIDASLGPAGIYFKPFEGGE